MLDPTLRPTTLMDCDSITVAAKARSLTRGMGDTQERAVALFYFVRDGIRYQLVDEFPGEGYFRASSTLTRGHGFCIPKAILLAALGRAAGIPTRLHVVDIVNHRLPEDLRAKLGTNLMRHHTYVEFLLEGEWVKANPAFNIELCHRFNLVPVEFTGEGHALFSPVDLEGTPHIDYVADHGVVEDLRYGDIRKVFLDGYAHLFR